MKLVERNDYENGSDGGPGEIRTLSSRRRIL